MINLRIDYLSVLNYKGQFLCSFPLVNLAARQLSPSQSQAEKSPYPRDEQDYLLLVSRWDYVWVIPSLEQSNRYIWLGPPFEIEVIPNRIWEL